MKLAKISQGGQIQIPAEVRHRWGTRDVMVVDGGNYLRISPVPDDPISAVRGIFAGPGPSASEVAQQWREEDIAAEEAKWARHYGRDGRP
jgi:hypothetical protein